MADVKVACFEEMEPIYDGLARRARATLGVTSFGMQVMTLPANWEGYPITAMMGVRRTPIRKRCTYRLRDQGRSSQTISASRCGRA